MGKDKKKKGGNNNNTDNAQQNINNHLANDYIIERLDEISIIIKGS